MNGSSLIPVNFLDKLDDFQHQIKSKFNKIFSSDEGSSSEEEDYRRKSQRRKERLPKHVKEQNEIFDQLYSFKVSPSKQQLHSAQPLSPKGGHHRDFIRVIEDQSDVINPKQPFYFQTQEGKIAQTPADRGFQNKEQIAIMESQVAKKTQSSTLNRRSLDRLDQDFLDSNLIKHIESKLKLGIPDDESILSKPHQSARHKGNSSNFPKFQYNSTQKASPNQSILQNLLQPQIIPSRPSEESGLFSQSLKNKFNLFKTAGNTQNQSQNGTDLVAQMKQTFVNTSPPKPFNPSTQIKPSTNNPKRQKQKRGPSALMKQIAENQINLRNVNLKMREGGQTVFDNQTVDQIVLPSEVMIDDSLKLNISYGGSTIKGGSMINQKETTQMFEKATLERFKIQLMLSAKEGNQTQRENAAQTQIEKKRNDNLEPKKKRRKKKKTSDDQNKVNIDGNQNQEQRKKTRLQSAHQVPNQGYTSRVIKDEGQVDSKQERMLDRTWGTMKDGDKNGDFVKRRQRSQSLKKKQLERYGLKVTSLEEEDDDECNISDDRSGGECPVSNNDQRKFEIERFVFKMNESHQHIESSREWFNSIKSEISKFPSDLHRYGQSQKSGSSSIPYINQQATVPEIMTQMDNDNCGIEKDFVSISKFIKEKMQDLQEKDLNSQKVNQRNHESNSGVYELKKKNHTENNKVSSGLEKPLPNPVAQRAREMDEERNSDKYTTKNVKPVLPKEPSFQSKFKEDSIKQSAFQHQIDQIQTQQPSFMKSFAKNEANLPTANKNSKLGRAKRFESVENSQFVINRKVSANGNDSIISTKRAPQNCNNLRNSIKDDPDKLMPAETIDEDESFFALKMSGRTPHSQSKMIELKETQPSSIRNGNDTPTLSEIAYQQSMQRVNQKTAKQKQLQQVSDYLNKYKQNLFQKGSSTALNQSSKDLASSLVNLQPKSNNEKVNLIECQFNNRILKTLLSNHEIDEESKRSQIKNLVLAGISGEVRKKLWSYLIQIKSQQKIFPRANFRKSYMDYKKSMYLKEIKQDVARTFQHIYYFKVSQGDESYDNSNQHDFTRNPLYNILVAYSNFDSDLGYAQGMNYLAGIFYQVFLDEYEAFLALHFVMHTLNWREIYITKAPRLQTLLLNLQRTLFKESRALCDQFQKLNILPTSVYSQFFMTLGSSCNITQDQMFQIMDIFLLEGEQALVSIMVNCLKIKQNMILSLDQEFDVCRYIQQSLLSECFNKNGLKNIYNYQVISQQQQQQ